MIYNFVVDKFLNYFVKEIFDAQDRVELTQGFHML
jgi:hypothetical protein